jgi:hypothetical protein
MDYGIYGKVHLWPYANQSSLRIDMAENRTVQATFSVVAHTEFQHYLKGLSESRQHN